MAEKEHYPASRQERQLYGLHEVWHADGVFGRFPDGSANFPAGFNHVADVQAHSVAEAYAASRGQVAPTWPDPPAAWNAAADRQTTLGDVIVDPNGTAFRVEFNHFEQVATQKPTFEQSLHAQAPPSLASGKAQAPAAGKEHDKGIEF